MKQSGFEKLIGRTLTNDEFAAFGIRNCEIRKYEFRG